MSYQLEVDCIAAAHALDILTTPYVFNPEEARLMTEAGADMGLTTGGVIGAETARTLDDCVPEVQAIIDVAKKIRREVLVLCHGGPISAPADAQFMLQQCRGLDGFYGASSMERLPTERALTAEVRQFANLELGPRLSTAAAAATSSPRANGGAGRRAATP